MNTFDWKQYISNYPGLNNFNEEQALNHYNRFGKKEKRTYNKIYESIVPVIVCVAKMESDYIKSFVTYHLALGFEKIFIYDNEEKSTYDKIINNEKVKIIHFPGNNFDKGIQYVILDHFVNNFINEGNYVCHIDIDEYIVLKKHNNIKEFIKEYIKGECGGIGMNWRHFGCNGHTEKSDIPEPIRFTRCELLGNKHIKTLFETSSFLKFNSSHDIISSKYVKNTNGKIIKGPFNEHICFDVIQLNHYKCKTLPEFNYISERGRPDFNNLNEKQKFNTSTFDKVDINEVEELTAFHFFNKNCEQT